MILSIIIPFYNVGEFSKKLLKSLLQISNKRNDVEFILIENASTDNTKEILHEYTQQFNNVNIIENKRNEGISEARNQGILLAHGEWIHFIDGDDNVDVSEYIKLIEKLDNVEADLDAVFFGYESVDVEGNVIRHGIQKRYVEEIIGNYELVNRIVNGTISNYPWGFVSRRETWIQHNILFPVGRTFEDMATLYKVSKYFRDIEFISLNIMKYVQRKNSITHTPTLKQIDDLGGIISEMSEDEFLSGTQKHNWALFMNIMQYQLLTLLPKDDERVLAKKAIIKSFLRTNTNRSSGKTMFLKNKLIQIGSYDWIYPLVHRYRR